MSKNVDEHVVEFQFDNTKFEKNIKKSQKSLNNFKESLTGKLDNNFVSDIGKQLASFPQRLKTNISDKITQFVLKPLDAVLNSINKISSLINSMSFDQISQGFNKYSEKTISIATLAGQTIKIAGKEITDYTEKMEYVNELVSKLNWFADQTSYSLTDMTSNVGKFTASGVDLDVAVEAMMGISNWAALSGQNSNAAARAMYNLAQALGAGYVKLIDWKSIQNANMDTQEFRATVLQTAVDLGELTKSGNEFITKTGKKFTQNQFTETLQEKWFNTKVLTTALKKYSSATTQIYEMVQETGLTAIQVMSRYSSKLDEFGLKAFKAAQEARTFNQAIDATKDAVSSLYLNIFEKVFGGYDEAKVVWSDFADYLWDIFASGLDNVNNILASWNKVGGRLDLFGEGGAFYNIMDTILELKNLGSGILSAALFSTSFEDDAEAAIQLGKNLKEFTKKLKDFTKEVSDNIKNSNELKELLADISTILKLIVTVIQATLYALQPLKQFITEIGKIYLSKKIENITNLIEYGFIPAVRYFITLCERLNNTFEELFYGSLKIEDILELFVIGFKEIKMHLSELPEIFNKIKSSFSSMWSFITSKLGKKKNQNGIINQTPENLNPQNVAQEVATGVTQLASNAGEIFINIPAQKSVEVITSSVSRLSSGPKKAEETGEETVKTLTYWEKLLEKLESLVVPLQDITLNLVDTLKEFLTTLSTLLKLIGTLLNKISTSLNKFNTDPDYNFMQYMKDQSGFIHGLLTFVTFMGTLTIAIGYVKKSVASQTVVLNDLSKSLKKWGSSKVIKELSFMVKDLALLILSFSVSMVLLSSVDPKVLWAGVAGLGVISGILIALAVVLKDSSTGLKVTAKATRSLKSKAKELVAEDTTSAFADVAKIIKTLAVSLLAIAAAITVLTIGIEYFSSKYGNGMNNPLIQASMILSGILIGIGLILLASQIKKGKTELNAVTQILKVSALVTSIALALASFTVSLYLMTKLFQDENMKKTALKALAVVGGAIAAISIISYIIEIIMAKTFNTKGQNGKTKNPTITSIKALANIMLSIGVAMLTFASAMWILSKINLDDDGMSKMWQFFGMIVGLVAVLTGLAAVMEKFSASSYSGLFDKIQSTVFIFTATATLITALAGAIVLLQTVEPKQMMATVGAMSLALVSILGSISLMMAASKRNSDQKTSYFAIISGLIGMVTAIGALFATMLLFGNDTKAVLTAAGAISAVVLVIFGMISILMAVANKSANAGLNLAALSGGLVGISAAIVVLGIALRTLEGMSWKDTWQGMTMVAAALIVLLAAGTLLGKTSVTLLSFAGALLVMTLSTYLFVAAVEALVNIFSSLATGVNENTQEISNNLATFLDSVVSILTDNKDKIIEVVSILITFVADAIITLITQLLNRIDEMLEPLLTALGKILTSVCGFIIEYVPMILETLGTVFQSLFKYITDSSPLFFETMFFVIDEFLKALANHAESIGYSVEDIINKVVVGALIALGDNLNPIVNAVMYFINKLADTLLTRAEDIANTLYNLVKKVFGALMVGILTLVMNEITDIAGIFGKGAEKKAQEACDNIMNKVRESFGIASPSKVTQEIGGYLSEGLAIGMEKKANTVKDEVENIGDIIKDSWTTAMEAAENQGQLTIRPVVDTSGVKDGVNDINNLMSNVNGTSVSANMANTTASEIRKSSAIRMHTKDENQNGVTNTTNNNSNYNATFYIESNDPEYIADEVDRIFKNKNTQTRLSKGY